MSAMPLRRDSIPGYLDRLPGSKPNPERDFTFMKTENLLISIAAVCAVILLGVCAIAFFSTVAPHTLVNGGF